MSGSLTTDKITWIERTFGLKLPMGPPPGDRPAAPGGKAPTGASDPSSSDVRAAMMTTAQDLLKDLGETVEFDDHPDAGVPTDAGPAKPGPDAAKLDADAKKIVAAMQDWKDRQAKITITYEMSSVLKPFQKAIENFAAALKTSVKKNDATDALNAMPAVETALKALEAEAARRAKDLPKKQKAATDAADKIDKMSDADIGKMKAEDKAALLREMLGAGKPTGKVRDAQKKLYADTDIDPDFRKDDEARQDKVAADLKNDKELATARGGWDTLDMEGLRKNLGKVVAAQSKEYGIAPPPIIFFPDEEEGISKAAGKVLGYFKESDGKFTSISTRPPASRISRSQSMSCCMKTPTTTRRSWQKWSRPRR